MDEGLPEWFSRHLVSLRWLYERSRQYLQPTTRDKSVERKKKQHLRENVTSRRTAR